MGVDSIQLLPVEVTLPVSAISPSRPRADRFPSDGNVSQFSPPLLRFDLFRVFWVFWGGFFTRPVSFSDGYFVTPNQTGHQEKNRGGLYSSRTLNKNKDCLASSSYSHGPSSPRFRFSIVDEFPRLSRRLIALVDLPRYIYYFFLRLDL